MSDPDASRQELTEQILGAEQDERRRIALFLHDGPVQSLSGVALMLDAALEKVGRRVEHERDARERLHRAIVKEQRDAATLILLGGEDLFGRMRRFVARH